MALFPCLPWPCLPRVADRSAPSAPSAPSASAPKARMWEDRLAALQEELWLKLLWQLAPLELAAMSVTSTGLRARQRAALAGTWGRLGLRACHALEAPLLAFAWLGTSRVASGEDGWETLLGSMEVARSKWLLEVLSLQGMLAVGVADQRLKSNALLGASSSRSWGWELTRKGIEAVASSAVPGAARMAPYSLEPSEGTRIILVLELSSKEGSERLDLSVLRLGLGGGCWEPLGRHIFRREEAFHKLKLRPAVSVDVGAAVRVLSEDLCSSWHESWMPR
ncbi:unnamed protein product [Effrenium voratum]|nr:unnamed protein product [Effrenium voratum]